MVLNSFSYPNTVGCLLEKKAYKEGGGGERRGEVGVVTGTPGPPSRHALEIYGVATSTLPSTYLKMVSYIWHSFSALLVTTIFLF